MNTSSPYRGVSIAAWLLLGLTCLVSLIPGIGFVTWLVAGPILLITVILGVVALAKGGTMQGVLILLVSLIAVPLFVFFAPIVATALLAAATNEGEGTVGEAAEAIEDTAFDAAADPFVETPQELPGE